MEQLIEAFGIDVKLIIVQILNFVVLVAALSYFLYKPVLKVLKDREDKINQGIADAEAAAVAKASAEEQKKAILSEANTAAEKVSAEAKGFADQKAAGIVKAAEEQAASIVKNAEAKSAELKAQTLKESEAEVAKLAILAAEKVLREKTT